LRQDYYIVESGRLMRRQNTVRFQSSTETIKLPINQINAIHVMGEVDLNKKLLLFLSQKHVPVHFYNYYGYYSGSYYPREYLNSGYLKVRQAEHYLDPGKRLFLAKEFALGSAENMKANLAYYAKRGKNLDLQVEQIQEALEAFPDLQSIDGVRAQEGQVRRIYYSSFGDILGPQFSLEKRSRRPPLDEINCLVSFGNSLLYTTVLTELYNTQLEPTISYLHEPGERRFSLSLDLSDVFKPILVDRCIFTLVNRKVLKTSSFSRRAGACYLNDEGKRKFLEEYDAKLKATFRHEKLNRSISYRQLIRVECYKLIKHMVGEQQYSAFRSRW